MNFYNAIEISASGLSAERLAMDVIANNIANANTTHTPQGGAFKRQLVVFAEKNGSTQTFPGDGSSDSPDAGGGVKALGIVQDNSPDRLVFDPSNPDADARGYVHYPNVSVVKEMVDLMAASRAYQADVSAMQEAKNMTNAALNLLKS